MSEAAGVVRNSRKKEVFSFTFVRARLLHVHHYNPVMSPYGEIPQTEEAVSSHVSPKCVRSDSHVDPFAGLRLHREQCVSLLLVESACLWCTELSVTSLIWNYWEQVYLEA